MKVVSGGTSGGTELWADFHLRLPAGTGVSIRNEVGRISALNVVGPLTADTGSGDIDVDLPGTKVRSERKLEIAVGGGGVPVKVHTSSGNIRLTGK